MEHSAGEPGAGGGVELAGPGGPRISRSRLRYAFSRASGPGGQAVNKLSTRAELRVAVDDIAGLSAAAAARLRRLAGRRLNDRDEIVIHAETARSQRDNRRECLERLRDMVRRALTPPKKRIATRPGRAARERRLRSKREQAEKKQRRQSPEES